MWLQRKTTWTSKDIQEEIIDLMSCDIMDHFTKQTSHRKYLGIIAYKTADISHVEQRICLRSVDNEFNPEEHARVFGFYALDKCDGESIF